MLPGQKLVNGHISVEPLPPLWLLYCKSAERVHRPGSRRLGGVEATGASPGVAPSRPHRSGPRAGPGRRTPCARGAWGGERAGGWASDLPALGNSGLVPEQPTSMRWCARAYQQGFRGTPLGKKGTRYTLSPMLLEQGDRTAPKIGKILRAGHQRFSTAFRSRVPFVRGSRGVLRDEAPTISSTDLGDRAEH